MLIWEGNKDRVTRNERSIRNNWENKREKKHDEQVMRGLKIALMN